MYYGNIREEEVKNKVGAEWFKGFDTTQILGNIDFSVFPIQRDLFEYSPLLWAEAKTGSYDVVTMFVQLILTIGQARTFDKMLPPAFLGAFDSEKIAFVPYISIQDVFYMNDFNWKVTPSNHDSREFALLKERIEGSLKKKSSLYYYEKDANELRFFIENNIAKGQEAAKIRIDKNNFLPIYLRWLEVIKPIIDVNWEELKQNNILDSDFYLADLFVDDKDTQGIADDISIQDNLFVIYKNQGYKIAKESLNQMFDATISIKHIEVYQQFWRRYKRPPIKAYQEYIIQRRDLLVPQDIRERKGAYFTPRIWVEKSQEYLASQFGGNWQEEYYIWDCAAGTGNLLIGLNNEYNIYASTLDQADVLVMQERAKEGAPLLESHIFQFDFLNDSFTPQSKGGKLPDSLYEIISNEEKRKKLIVYINPPYAEATSGKTSAGTGKNKAGVALNNKTHDKYAPLIGDAANELFAQFLIRIYRELPLCKIAEFSTLKTLQSYNFSKFREHYRAKLGQIFCVPANTFDNVKGDFPIGFKIWDGEKEEVFSQVKAKFLQRNGEVLFSAKTLFPTDKTINDWRKSFCKTSQPTVGLIVGSSPDYQNNTKLAILSKPQQRYCLPISLDNIKHYTVYFAVRLCIKAEWHNDRDVFLPPQESWIEDKEFQGDCLAFTLFHGQNRITSEEGVNHWIPFTEKEVNAPERFESHWMTDYITGKLIPQTKNETEYFPYSGGTDSSPIKFSIEAQAVFNSGRELWRYYMSQPKANPNASFYDIRAHFQGFSEKRNKIQMNPKSTDDRYTELVGNLREQVQLLGEKIRPKVFEHGFLKG